MARSKATKAPVPSEPLHVLKQPDESEARALARTVLWPTVNNAETIRRVSHRDLGETRLNELVKELSAQCDAVSRGDMGRPESLLTTQAHTLDALFNDLTRLAYRNWSNLAAAERLLRLAFKAQSQGRATVEALGNLRNPPMVIARQANIAHGPQQVNNDAATSTHAHARTREVQSEPSKLLQQTDGERLDTGGVMSSVLGTDATVETVAEIRDGSNC